MGEPLIPCTMPPVTARRSPSVIVSVSFPPSPLRAMRVITASYDRTPPVLTVERIVASPRRISLSAATGMAGSVPSGVRLVPKNAATVFSSIEPIGEAARAAAQLSRRAALAHNDAGDVRPVDLPAGGAHQLAGLRQTDAVAERAVLPVAGS